MFGLFGKKEKDIITDKVWFTTEAKWAACRQLATAQPDTLFVTWFEDTFHQLENALINNGLTADKIVMARQLTSHFATVGSVVFAEHYPLRAKEEELCQKAGITAAAVFSALDEPLFKHFGSDKIIGLARSFGMKEEEAIEHTMVSSAIKNAQEKIAAKVTLEQAALSQADWLMKNLVA